MKIITLAFLLWFLALTTATAQDAVISEQVEKRFITAYDKGFSSILEFRTVNLEKGKNEIIIKGIPEIHDLGRISVFLNGTFVKASISKNKSAMASLFTRLDGKSVKLKNSESSFKGNLSVHGGSLMLESDDNVFLTREPANYFLFPLEDEISLIGEAGINLHVNSNITGEQTIILLYGTKQIGWTVLHSLRLYPQNLTYDWYAEAQVFNNSGIDFKSTYLRLFSGDLDVRDMPRVAGNKLRRSLGIYDELIDMDAFLEMNDTIVSGYSVQLRGADSVTRVVFEDYFAYDFQEPLTLRSGAIETIKLHYFTGLNYTTKNFVQIPAQRQTNVPVTKTAVINNSENRIPLQMPAGTVYTSSFTSEGLPVFEGQNNVTATPPGLKRYIATGEYVPVEVKHHFNRISRRTENSYDDHTITVENISDEYTEVIFRRSFHNVRTIVEHMPEYFFQEGNYIMAVINLEPGEVRTFSLRFLTPPP